MKYLKKITYKKVTYFKTLEELEKWLKFVEKDDEGNEINSIKVFGFFYDVEETEDDISEFYRAAELSLQKTEVYFAQVLFKLSSIH